MSLSVHIEKKLGKFSICVHFEAENVTTALLGASGSGKSVTLKCIAGIMTPDRGKIVLDGKTLFDSEKHIDLPPQERHVGYLFQQYALFPNMTVEENIRCGIRSKSREERKTLLTEYIRRFRLEDLKKKYPSQLSGGQQQRVSLARILASEPKAILLDEPFSALDSYLKWDLEMELSDLLKEFHGPILWVSHDLGECFRNCSKVCVMDNGLSGELTDMESLLQHPATQSAARLIGCCNFWKAKQQTNGLEPDDWDLLLPLTGFEECVTVAIPDCAVTIGTGPYSARVAKVIGDVDKSVVLLQSEKKNSAQTLRVSAEKEKAPAVGTIVRFDMDIRKCFVYSDG